MLLGCCGSEDMDLESSSSDAKLVLTATRWRNPKWLSVISVSLTMKPSDEYPASTVGLVMRSSSEQSAWDSVNFDIP